MPDVRPVVPLGQATEIATLTPPPDVPVSWPWSATRAVTIGSRRIDRMLLAVVSWPFCEMVTNAVAVAVPSTHLFPFTTLVCTVCGAPVHDAAKLPEPPGSACRT